MLIANVLEERVCLWIDHAESGSLGARILSETGAFELQQTNLKHAKNADLDNLANQCVKLAQLWETAAYRKRVSENLRFY